MSVFIKNVSHQLCLCSETLSFYVFVHMWGFYLSCCPECTEGRSVNNPWFRSLLLWLRDKFSLVRLKVGLLISCHISMTSVLYLSIDQDFWKIVPVLNKHRQFFLKFPYQYCEITINITFVCYEVWCII